MKLTAPLTPALMRLGVWPPLPGGKSKTILKTRILILFNLNG